MKKPLTIFIQKGILMCKLNKNTEFLKDSKKKKHPFLTLWAESFHRVMMFV